MKRLGGVIVCLAMSMVAAQAADFTVGPGGDYATIQAGIDAALAAGGSNEVKVAQGAYLERLSITAEDLGMATVSGGWLAGFAERVEDPATATIIDAESGGPVLKILSAKRGAMYFDGFTFTGGFVADGGGLCPVGGGLQLSLGDTAVVGVRRSTIHGNQLSTGEGCPAEGGGIGAILQDSSTLLLRSNEIRGNRASSVGNSADGGGLSVFAGGTSEFQLTQCVVSENEAASAGSQATGGGLFFSTDSEAVSAHILDNWVTANRLDAPAGVCVGGCLWIGAADRIEVRRNRWQDNVRTGTEQLSLITDGLGRMVWGDDVVAGGAGGAYLDVRDESTLHATNLTVVNHTELGLFSFLEPAGTLSLFNSIVFGNGTNVDLPPSAWTDRNSIGINPRFVDPDGPSFNVLPGSPVIDAGTDAAPAGLGPQDVAHLARVQGEAVDIGAHEAGAGTSSGGWCRIERFGETPRVPDYAPVCSCLQDDVARNMRCGFHFPEFFAVVRVPWPVPPFADWKAEWTIHPWGPGEAPFEMKAVALVGGKEIPVEGKGTSGKLREGKDVSVGLKPPGIPESGVLRTLVRHLPAGAKAPVTSVAEVAIETSAKPK